MHGSRKAREMLRYLSIQVLPEEYEEECGLELEDGLEAYERMVLKSREALRSIDESGVLK